jgi:F0F1-type ATP synthase delta subunit
VGEWLKMLEDLKEIIKLFLEHKKDKQYDPYRDQRIYVRVTEDEKDMIKKLAKIQGRDVSNFIRWLALNKYLNDFIQ